MALPKISSLKVCAFISSREVATNPVAINKNTIIKIILVSKCRLTAIANTDKAVIPIMCKLALYPTKSTKSANTVLIKLPKKKKYNSAQTKMVMLFCIKIESKMA